MFTGQELSFVVAAAVIGLLLLILVVSFASRPRVFCQYLRTMTGIDLKPRMVKEAFKLRGKEGVRELFLDLIIREDAKSSPPITPDSKPQRSITDLVDR
jgi:hypothetical protein